MRLWRHGDADAKVGFAHEGNPFIPPKPYPKSCVICGKPTKNRGFCNAHYLKLIRHGDPNHENKQKGKCTICGEPNFGKGLCNMHYQRWKTHGDPLLGAMKHGPNIYLSKRGYYVMTIGGKVRTIHRLIMEAHIGRPLQIEELVHHKNENKLDNRIENLEIVSRPEHRGVLHIQPRNKLNGRFVK